jgi:hypothetical protein
VRRANSVRLDIEIAEYLSWHAILQPGSDVTDCINCVMHVSRHLTSPDIPAPARSQLFDFDEALLMASILLSDVMPGGHLTNGNCAASCGVAVGFGAWGDCVDRLPWPVRRERRRCENEHAG